MSTELSPSSALGARQRCRKAAGQGPGVAHSPSAIPAATRRGARARRLLPPVLTPLPHLPRDRDVGPMRAVLAALTLGTAWEIRVDPTRRDIRLKHRKRRQPRVYPRATRFGTLFGKINNSATFQENGSGWREREKAVWKCRNSLRLSIHNQKRGWEIKKHNMLLMTFPLNTNI